SIVDVMIALVILMVGILGLLSVISIGLLQSRGQATQLGAKQIATSTIESIMSVKETSDPSRLGWIAVGNVGSNPNALNVPQGIFVTGFQPVRAAAGVDEVVGTADDAGAVSPDYLRQIVITDICDPDRPSANCPTPGIFPVRIRSVQVTVSYFVGQVRRQEVLNTVLTDYAAN
ncbi:MAG: hypothetical protein HOP17_01440, partial [Acidobacteria bacterium]|nr:hypothetical protein [Acidobacteriota bacterium]